MRCPWAVLGRPDTPRRPLHCGTRGRRSACYCTRPLQVLVKTNVTKYLEFKAVDGSFVVNAGKVEKVPATAMEALKSPLMGFFEKRRAAKFFRCPSPKILDGATPPPPVLMAWDRCWRRVAQRILPKRTANTLSLLHSLLDTDFMTTPGGLSYCQDYDPENTATYQGRNLKQMSMTELYKAFGLDEQTQVPRRPCHRTLACCQLHVQMLSICGPVPFPKPLATFSRLEWLQNGCTCSERGLCSRASLLAGGHSRSRSAVLGAARHGKAWWQLHRKRCS